MESTHHLMAGLHGAEGYIALFTSNLTDDYYIGALSQGSFQQVEHGYLSPFLPLPRCSGHLTKPVAMRHLKLRRVFNAHNLMAQRYKRGDSVQQRGFT